MRRWMLFASAITFMTSGAAVAQTAKAVRTAIVISVGGPPLKTETAIAPASPSAGSVPAEGEMTP